MSFAFKTAKWVRKHSSFQEGALSRTYPSRILSDDSLAFDVSVAIECPAARWSYLSNVLHVQTNPHLVEMVFAISWLGKMLVGILTILFMLCIHPMAIRALVMWALRCRIMYLVTILGGEVLEHPLFWLESSASHFQTLFRDTRIWWGPRSSEVFPRVERVLLNLSHSSCHKFWLDTVQLCFAGEHATGLVEWRHLWAPPPPRHHFNILAGHWPSLY